MSSLRVRVLVSLIRSWVELPVAVKSRVRVSFCPILNSEITVLLAVSMIDTFSDWVATGVPPAPVAILKL